jgi:hypothetical protein
MGGHALRGAITAWLGLIVLQAVVSNSTGKVASAFSDLDGLLQRAFDPGVPAIPDRRATVPTSSSAGATANPSSVYHTPADLLPGSAIGSQPVVPRNIR